MIQCSPCPGIWRCWLCFSRAEQYSLRWICLAFRFHFIRSTIFWITSTIYIHALCRSQIVQVSIDKQTRQNEENKRRNFQPHNQYHFSASSAVQFQPEPNKRKMKRLTDWLGRCFFLSFNQVPWKVMNAYI